MANSKISALTSATTPLAGTETLPIVQGGATVKATVANITGAGAYAGSFTSLDYTTTLTGGTGIVNLGSNQFYKNATGNIGIGTATVTGISLAIGKNITGAAISYGVLNNGTVQSDVGTACLGYQTSISTQAAVFTLSNLSHVAVSQATIGSSSIVTSQYGFVANSNLTGATNNYGFYGNIAAPTSGIATTGTITTLSSTTTTVTVNHNAITYTNGQFVTISATANATALVSGATCTILTVGTTDFTLIGAASNTVGVSFTATGVGTGSGTVTLNVQGSGKTVAGAASGSFTYTTTTSQTFAAVTVLTGSVTVSRRYNLYMNGTASNYLAGGLNVGATADPGAGNISLTGNLAVGVTSPAVKLDVLGTVQAAAAATQDAVRLAGRAGGTGTYAVTLTPTTLTASRTLTLPDATTTVVGTDATQTLTNKWVQPRVLASTANSATPTLNTDNYDMMVITGQVVAITSFTTNLTGTPVNGQKLIIAITGTGAIGITWGASFEASTVALPTTTVTTNRLDVGFIWNVATTKWRCVAVA